MPYENDEFAQSQAAEAARYVEHQLTQLRRQAESIDQAELRIPLVGTAEALAALVAGPNFRALVRAGAYLEQVVRAVRIQARTAPVVLYLRGATPAQANTDHCRQAAARLGLTLLRVQRSSPRTRPESCGHDPVLTTVLAELRGDRISGVLTYSGMLGDWPAWREAFRAAGGAIHYLPQPLERQQPLPAVQAYALRGSGT